MKLAIVTGAAGQLGKAFVKTLVLQDYFVYAVDLKPIALRDKRVETIQLDITNEDDVKSFFARLKTIDVLINNAGIGVFTPFENRSASEFRAVTDVNLLGTFLMAQGAINLMKKQRSGKIINIASVYGMRSSDERIYGQSGRNNSEVYSATKAGVISLTTYMAAHFGKFGIQINAISPGGVFNHQSNDFVTEYENKTPMGRMAQVEDLISTMLYLISDETKYTNGQNISVDGGFTAW